MPTNVACKLYFAASSMHYIITSYLLQAGECTLPMLGTFNIIQNPAVIDADSNTIQPPNAEIIFTTKNGSVSKGLIKYTAIKKGVNEEDSKLLITTFCNDWKERIKQGEILKFETIGSLKENEDNEIHFTRDNGIQLLQPIHAAAVASEIDNVRIADNEPITENTKPGSTWKYFATLLVTIALGVIFYWSYKNHYSIKAFGNQQKIITDSAEARHTQMP